jgi:hypothetical protein
MAVNVHRMELNMNQYAYGQPRWHVILAGGDGMCSPYEQASQRSSRSPKWTP